MASQHLHEDPLICPIRGEFQACDPQELKPLVQFLKEGRGVCEPTAFPRGTMLPDGRLDLCKQSIGADGASIVADGLQGTHNTKHLLLGANGLGSAGAKAVAEVVRESDSLETVYLGCNMIGADAVEELVDAIQAGSSVTSLWLKRNPIGERGARAVANLLRSQHGLKCLDLVHTEMEDEGLADVLSAMTTDNRTVEWLYLCGNRIRSEQCGQIAELLESNPNLQHLYLSVNQIGDAGCRTIAMALRGNRTLKTLSLSSNRIGCDGASVLADALPSSELQNLELGCESSTFVLGEQPNEIGDAGAKALAQALPHCLFLQTLDLRRNPITVRGFRALLNGLDENSSLCDLRLSGSWSRDLKDRLNDSLARNRSLCTAEAVADPFVKAIQSVYRVPVGS